MLRRLMSALLIAAFVLLAAPTAFAQELGTEDNPIQVYFAP